MPHKTNLNRWCQQFIETEWLFKDTSSGQPHVFVEMIQINSKVAGNFSEVQMFQGIGHAKNDGVGSIAQEVAF